MVGGTLLAVAVLQVKGEQAGEAGAASTPCQQGSNRLLEDGRSAACGDRASTGLERACRIQICPRVHGHLTKQEPITRLFPVPKFCTTSFQRLEFARSGS